MPVANCSSRRTSVCRDGHRQKPSWCFAVSTANRIPAALAASAHCPQSRSDGANDSGSWFGSTHSASWKVPMLKCRNMPKRQSTKRRCSALAVAAPVDHGPGGRGSAQAGESTAAPAEAAAADARKARRPSPFDVVMGSPLIGRRGPGRRTRVRHREHHRRRPGSPARARRPAVRRPRGRACSGRAARSRPAGSTKSVCGPTSPPYWPRFQPLRKISTR